LDFEHRDVYEIGGGAIRLPFEDERFDCVIAASARMASVAAAENAADCLRELGRVLRDDGVLLLSGALDAGTTALTQMNESLAAVAAQGATLRLHRVAHRALAALGPGVGPDLLVLRRGR
jgi:SAM-dependent methyltransferase